LKTVVAILDGERAACLGGNCGFAVRETYETGQAERLAD
jgi:hypothetical protein